MPINTATNVAVTTQSNAEGSCLFSCRTTYSPRNRPDSRPSVGRILRCASPDRIVIGIAMDVPADTPPGIRTRELEALPRISWGAGEPQRDHTGRGSQYSPQPSLGRGRSDGRVHAACKVQTATFDTSVGHSQGASPTSRARPEETTCMEAPSTPCRIRDSPPDREGTVRTANTRDGEDFDIGFNATPFEQRRPPLGMRGESCRSSRTTLHFTSCTAVAPWHCNPAR